MSTMLYGANELGNLAAAVRYDVDQDRMLDWLAKISAVNTQAYNANYNQEDKPLPVEDIKSCIPSRFDLEKAVGSALLLHYNCHYDGVEPGKEQLRALVGVSNEVLGRVNAQFFDGI